MHFVRYLAETKPILAAATPPEDLDTFEEVYARVEGASSPLVAICDHLVTVQAEGFSEFLAETQGTLEHHKRLFELISAIIMVLAGTLALLVYRG